MKYQTEIPTGCNHDKILTWVAQALCNPAAKVVRKFITGKDGLEYCCGLHIDINKEEL